MPNSVIARLRSSRGDLERLLRLARNDVYPLHRKLFYLLILLLPTQLGLHFWPEWAKIFGIRVDYLAPTVFLTDLIIVGILASWAIEKFLNLRHLDFISNFKFKITNYWLLLFVYLLLTSLFIAQNQGAAVYKLVKLVEFVFLGFYVSQNKSQITNRLSLITFPLLFSSLLAWFQFLTGHTLGLWILGERSFDIATPGIALVNIHGQDYLRPYATFPHPNALAGFLLVGLIFVMLNLFQHPERFRNKFGMTVFVIIGVSTLFITFSHSAWLAGFAVFLIYIIPALRTRIHTLTKLLLFALILGSFLLSAALSPSSFPQEVRQRVELAQAGLEMSKDLPLTGVGLNNFIVRLSDYVRNLGPARLLQPVHNIFLLVLTETGLIGFSIFLWFLIKAVSKFEIFNLKFSIAFLVILITGMLDHYWLTIQQGQLMTAIVLGALFARHGGIDS